MSLVNELGMITDIAGKNTCSEVALVNNRISMALEEKLEILSDAAKYDVACTSSGTDRRGKEGFLGNSCAAGVCHSFAADGRCISLLKILMTNHCAYDCKYCKNRKSNDIKRATFTPDEICRLTIEFYKRNYIEGLFLSSGVLKNPEYTMEKMVETLRLLRTKYRFNGYIHVKAIPGASSELIYSAGILADRISINMELPTEDSLSRLAPNKSMMSIVKPMNQITNTIMAHRTAIGKDMRFERAMINRHLNNSIWGTTQDKRIGSENKGQLDFINKTLNTHVDDTFAYPADISDTKLKRPFASAGQSTQMIIGASGETDLDLIRMTQGLYQGFDLRRVFYSAYIPINEDDALPSLDTPVPLLREHRLYQADWLLRYYGFQANELLSEDKPYFDQRIDPKCNWAIRHLECFPVEVNTASYDLLLRVPGIGPKSVQRIIAARKHSHLTFQILKKIGVVLKRAQYFITCGGRMMYKIPFEQSFILGELTNVEKREVYSITNQDDAVQMDLFRDFGLMG